jgi:hypothetical protein
MKTSGSDQDGRSPANDETWIKTNVAAIRGWERRAAEGLRARRPLAHAHLPNRLKAAALTRLACRWPRSFDLARPSSSTSDLAAGARLAFLPPTRRTSIRSSRYSKVKHWQWPSNRGHPRPRRKAGRRPSLKANALTTSATPDVLPAKPARLQRTIYLSSWRFSYTQSDLVLTPQRTSGIVRREGTFG